MEDHGYWRGQCLFEWLQGVSMGGEDFRLLLFSWMASGGMLTAAVAWEGCVACCCLTLTPPPLLGVALECIVLRDAVGSTATKGASKPKICLVPPLLANALGDIMPFLGDLENR